MTQPYAQQIADDFVAFLDEFHTYQEPFDDALELDQHERFARVLREQSKYGYFPFEKGVPVFGPSSAGKSDRELYEKVSKSPKDKREWLPHQRRWTAIGTTIGSAIQHEVLLAERHFERLTGKTPRFKFARTDDGDPAFEEFTKKLHYVDYGGARFGLLGLADGILEYTADDGEVLRVGLECKSKQKSYGELKRLKEPQESHAAQTVAYSEMYGLDYFIVLYVNASKKSWFEYYPDLKAFGRYITQADRDDLKAKLADVVHRANDGAPPTVALDSFLFNDYRTHIARTMTDDELAQAREKVRQAQRGNLPAWQKAALKQAYHDIIDIREGAGDGA